MSRRAPQPARNTASPAPQVSPATNQAKGSEIVEVSLPNRSVRFVVSGLVSLHLLAIFMAPLSARPNPSAISRSLVDLFQPYLDTAYLNHGYGFFSPDPGSSMLIRYEVELPDGTVETGTLPDRKANWPRLLYHRHFMLSSQSNSFPGLPESYARHLQHRFGGGRVKLQLVEHIPASPENILERKLLTDPTSYVVQGEATLDAEGNYSQRNLVPPPGEVVLPPGGLQPDGSAVDPEVDPEFGQNTYRGPFAPPRPTPQTSRGEDSP